MSLADVLLIAFKLCSFLYDALVETVSSLFVTGKFVYGFGNHGLNGISAALDYIPTCTDNSLICGYGAFRIFFWHLSKSSEILEFHTHFWNIVVCLLVMCCPHLRQIVSICLSFIVTFSFAIIVRLLGTARNRNVRRRGRNGLLRWSLATLMRGFKYFKTQLRANPGQRPHVKLPEKSRSNSAPVNTNLTCIVCFERPKCVVFMPCRHACLCMICTKALLQRQRLCPLCREHIASSMQIYI